MHNWEWILTFAVKLFFMGFTLRIGILIAFLLGGIGWSGAQVNPFELVPRLDPEVQDAIEEAPPHPTGNPFDVVPPPRALARERAFLIVEPQEQKISAPNRFRRFVFSVNLFSLILLTFLFTVFRGLILKVYQGVLNENILNQIFRDRDSIGPFPYWILYLLFFLNAGFFVFLLGHHYGKMPWPADSYLIQWVKCCLLVMALFLLKHFVLNVIAYVFPVGKEVKLYSFMIMVFSIVLGVALTPFNLLIAYLADGSGNWTLTVILLVIGLFYLFRYLRGTMIANKYLVFHKFHFLLYICTVEIAPIMVLLKLIQG